MHFTHRQPLRGRDGNAINKENSILFSSPRERDWWTDWPLSKLSCWWPGWLWWRSPRKGTQDWPSLPRWDAPWGNTITQNPGCQWPFPRTQWKQRLKRASRVHNRLAALKLRKHLETFSPDGTILRATFPDYQHEWKTKCHSPAIIHIPENWTRTFIKNGIRAPKPCIPAPLGSFGGRESQARTVLLRPRCYLSPGLRPLIWPPGGPFDRAPPPAPQPGSRVGDGTHALGRYFSRLGRQKSVLCRTLQAFRETASIDFPRRGRPSPIPAHTWQLLGSCCRRQKAFGPGGLFLPREPVSHPQICPTARALDINSLEEIKLPPLSPSLNRVPSPLGHCGEGAPSNPPPLPPQ